MKTSRFSKLITWFARVTSTGEPVLFDTYVMIDGTKLKVYLTGHNQSQFKFVYRDGKKQRVLYRSRLVRDRAPMNELRMGIHDPALSKFTNSTIRFFK